jgi:pimeloyl-ACP methyl ester carboxylesterase
MSAPDSPSLASILAQLPVEAEAPVAKNNENTIDIGIVPVVFVPGVMGTRLEFKSDGGHWDPDSEIALASWSTDLSRTVYLRFRSNTAVILGESSLLFDRGFAQIVQRVYGKFLDFLAAAMTTPFCPVHAVGYDWTQSNAVSAARLDDEVQRICKMWGAKKVVIVTHSMGGIVARAACLRPGFKDRVAGIIHTVQPALGASLTYRQFLTGSTGGAGASLFSLPGIKAKLMDNLIGNEWWKYMANIAVLRGPAELMPPGNYQLSATDPQWLLHSHGNHVTGARTAVPVDVARSYAVYMAGPPFIFPNVVFLYDPVVGFSESEWEQVRDDLFATLLDAFLFHTHLGVTCHPNTSVLASIQNGATESGVHGTDFPTAPFFSHSTMATPGDDTVPVFSATAIKPQEDGVVIPDPVAAKPKRLLVGALDGHQKVLDNSEARAFIVENIRYFVQKAKGAPPP